MKSDRIKRMIVDASGGSRVPKQNGVIGLNMGFGGRCATRPWPDAYWVKPAKELKKAGDPPVLPYRLQENAKNKQITQLSKAR